jgi:3-hydroxyisobutyrate dehydrogenase-like beta-hydroxyacid dehydrogenase
LLLGASIIDAPEGRLRRTAFARAHHYVGAFGAGSKMKFVANLLVAIHNVAAAEALVLAMKAGLDPAMVVKVVGDGAGSSRMLQVRGPMMVKGDYSEAMMKLDTWQKDMTIIADFAREVGCQTPLFSASAPLFAAAIAMGHHADDTAAVCAVLEKMANHHRLPRKVG